MGHYSQTTKDFLSNFSVVPKHNIIELALNKCINYRPVKARWFSTMRNFSKIGLKIMVVAMMTSGIIPANGHGEIHILISRLDKEIASNPSDTEKR